VPLPKPANHTQFLQPPPTPRLNPGVLAVKRVDGIPTVFPADGGEVSPEEDLLEVRSGLGRGVLVEGRGRDWFEVGVGG